MKHSNTMPVLLLYLGSLSSIAHAKSTYSSVTLTRPVGRSDWHHEQFQTLYLASLEANAQTNFGYWCGPTLGGYCGSTNFNDINTAVVTHVPFAFAMIATDGTVSYEYDQGSVAQYNSSILIEKGVMAGLSLGGSGTNANNCLENIDTCVSTLGKTLEYYENIGSPFYFVDSDFESPQDATQMQNLITFWLTFNAKYPGYLITMAPECAYLWCGAANWPYNSYVNVVNQLGPYGSNIIYKINAQSYNNWCSNSDPGTVPFFEDVATTWIAACPSTGYLGLEKNANVFGLGVLAADKDGDGYAPPDVVAEALASIGASYGTYNGMFWDTLTDLGNNWVISKSIAAAASDISAEPTIAPTCKPTAPTVAPTEKPSLAPSIAITISPTAGTTQEPTAPTGAPTVQPAEKDAGSKSFFESGMFKGLMIGSGATIAVGVVGFFVHKACRNTSKEADYAQDTQNTQDGEEAQYNQRYTKPLLS